MAATTVTIQSATDLSASPTSQSSRPRQSDFALVVGIARRQPDALAETFERYSASSLELAVQLAGGVRAPAVVHHVFQELWHTAPHLDPAPSDLRMHLLARTAVWAGGGRKERSPDGTPGDVIVQFARLPARQRDAIHESRVSGATYRQVAAKLRRSEESVRRDVREGLTALHRGLHPKGANRETRDSRTTVTRQGCTLRS